jgi:hypothetical protein
MAGVMHLVLFKWKEDAAPESIETAMQGLRNMAGRIPGVEELSCGANFTQRSKGYTHGLTVRFTDEAALDVYIPHPVHQDVVQNLINPIVDDVLALDYRL